MSGSRILPDGHGRRRPARGAGARARRRGRWSADTDARADRAAAVDPEAVALICYTSGSTSRPEGGDAHPRRPPRRGTVVRPGLAPRGEGHDARRPAVGVGLRAGDDVDGDAGRPAAGCCSCAAATPTRCCGPSSTTAPRSSPASRPCTSRWSACSKPADAARPRPADLRLCISGGEPRNDVAFARWRELTGCPVHDVYAASEAFPLVTYDPDEDPEPVPGSAGRVVAEAELRVVDADGADVPPGQPGEAWARSPAQMVGYWRDPELTAAALTGDGWYRTGDLVEVDQRGLRARRGPAERPHHPRRVERVAGRGRSGPGRAPRRAGSGRRRPARPGLRRAGGRRRRARAVGRP